MRDLAGDVDGLAALDFPAVGETGRLRETRWIDGLHGLGHGFPLSRAWLRAIILPGLHGPLLREGHARRRRRPSPPRHEGACSRPGCGDPSALVAEILRQADRLAPLTLMGGLRLDDYPFGAPAYAGKLRFATWHMSPRLTDAAARGDVDFVPARYFDTVSLFAAGGPWAPDAVLVHAAPPDRGGYLSLGVSVSYLLVRGAPGAARHRPGEPADAAHARQRLPPSLADRLLGRGGRRRCSSTRRPRSGRSSGASPDTWPSSSPTGRRSRWAWARSRRR